jgi:hypothetical protein
MKIHVFQKSLFIFTTFLILLVFVALLNIFSSGMIAKVSSADTAPPSMPVVLSVDTVVACPNASELGIDNTGTNDVLALLETAANDYDCLNLSGTFRLVGSSQDRRITIDNDNLVILGSPTLRFAYNNVFLEINADNIRIEGAKFDFQGHHFYASSPDFISAPIVINKNLSGVSFAGSEFYDVDGAATQFQQYMMNVSVSNTQLDLTNTYFHDITQISQGSQGSGFCGGIFITDNRDAGEYTAGGHISIVGAHFENMLTVPNPDPGIGFYRNCDAVRSYVTSLDDPKWAGTSVDVFDSNFDNVDWSSTKLDSVKTHVKGCVTTNDITVSGNPDYFQYAAYRANATSDFTVEDVVINGHVRNGVVVRGSNIHVSNVHDHSDRYTGGNTGNTVQLGIYNSSQREDNLAAGVVISGIYTDTEDTGVYFYYADDVEASSIEGIRVNKLLKFYSSTDVTVDGFSLTEGKLFHIWGEETGDGSGHGNSSINLRNGSLNTPGGGSPGAIIDYPDNISLETITIPTSLSPQLKVNNDSVPSEITKTDCNF